MYPLRNVAPLLHTQRPKTQGALKMTKIELLSYKLTRVLLVIISVGTFINIFGMAFWLFVAYIAVLLFLSLPIIFIIVLLGGDSKVFNVKSRTLFNVALNTGHVFMLLARLALFVIYVRTYGVQSVTRWHIFHIFVPNMIEVWGTISTWALEIGVYRVILGTVFIFILWLNGQSWFDEGRKRGP